MFAKHDLDLLSFSRIKEDKEDLWESACSHRSVITDESMRDKEFDDDCFELCNSLASQHHGSSNGMTDREKLLDLGRGSVVRQAVNLEQSTCGLSRLLVQSTYRQVAPVRRLLVFGDLTRQLLPDAGRCLSFTERDAQSDQGRAIPERIVRLVWLLLGRACVDDASVRRRKGGERSPRR